MNLRAYLDHYTFENGVLTLGGEEGFTEEEIIMLWEK